MRGGGLCFWMRDRSPAVLGWLGGLMLLIQMFVGLPSAYAKETEPGQMTGEELREPIERLRLKVLPEMTPFKPTGNALLDRMMAALYLSELSKAIENNPYLGSRESNQIVRRLTQELEVEIKTVETESRGGPAPPVAPGGPPPAAPTPKPSPPPPVVSPAPPEGLPAPPIVQPAPLQPTEAAPPSEAPAPPPVSSPGGELVLTLKESIQRALQGNRDFRNSVARLERSRFDVSEARARLQPVVTPSATLGIDHDKFTSLFGGNIAEDRIGRVRQLGLEISERLPLGTVLSAGVSQTILTGDPIEPGGYDPRASFVIRQPLLRDAWPLVVEDPLRAAEQGVNSQRNRVESDRQQLMLRVVNQYYRILSLKQVLEITQKGLDRADRLLKATEAKLKMELATALDLARAQVQRASQRQAVSRAVQDLQTAEDELRVMLGLPLEQAIQLVQTTIEPPSERRTEAMAPELVAVALVNRPDFRNNQIALDEAARISQVRWRERLPRADLFLTYDMSRETPGSVMFGGGWGLDRRDWTAGFQMSYPLPWTAASAHYQQAEIDLEIRHRTLEQQRAEIGQTVKADLRNVIALEDRLGDLKTEIENAERRLKIANFRFERGLADNFEVVNAEAALQNADFGYSRGVAELLIAHDRLRLDMGILRYEE